MRKYLWMSTTYMGLALAAGVFYREFTKLSGFEGVTVLGKTHTHLMTLGFMFGLILLLLEKSFSISKAKAFNVWFGLYNASLAYVAIAMVARGIGEVKMLTMPGLNHIAGLGHALLGVSLIWFVIILFRMIPKENN